MPREIGDIENDLGFVEGLISELMEDLADCEEEKRDLACELAEAKK